MKHITTVSGSRTLRPGDVVRLNAHGRVEGAGPGDVVVGEVVDIDADGNASIAISADVITVAKPDNISLMAEAIADAGD